MAATLENALRLVKPGDMVVSISEIFDKLGKKLTPDDRQQLMIAILSRKQGQVNPGDLITADLINQILTALVDLETRILRLESQQPIADTDAAIVRIVPSGNLTVGQEISIEGRNFEFSSGSAYVSLGKKSVFSFKAGSRDDRLIVEVPDPGALPIGGSQLPLTVSNRTSTDYRMVTVLPATVPLFGNVFASPGTVDPNPPVASTDTFFPYTITSAASREAVFVITALLAGPGEPLDAVKYAHLVTILDKDKAALPGGRLKLADQATAQIFVKVSQLPFATSFTVLVKAQAPGISGESAKKEYVVGAQDTDDDLITLDPPTFSPTSPANGALKLKANTASKATLSIRLSDKAIASGVSSATCDLKLLLSDGSGWSLFLLDPIPLPGTTEFKGLPLNGSVAATIEFAVSAAPNPSRSAGLQLTIARTGQVGTTKTKPYTLALQVEN